MFLYDEPSVPHIEIVDLARFIGKELGAEVEVRRSFFHHFKAERNVLHALASCRIFNTFVPFEKHMPSTEETDFEGTEAPRHLVLYDGFEIQNVYRDSIPPHEISQDQFHIVLTKRLACTYDHNDYRYHGRAVICSNPAIISTTGIIEAPAKPRDFYLKVREKIAQGLNLDSIKDEIKDRFMEYNDPRLGMAVRIYAMQAIFYYLTGMPFCESRECLLYNAHWQEELIHSLEIGRLCNAHRHVLDNYRNCYV